MSSLISQTKGKKKKNLKLRRKKLNKQIQNIVDNNQNQIASFVARTSEEIITSKLDLKSMIKKSKRNINKNGFEIWITIGLMNLNFYILRIFQTLKPLRFLKTGS